MKRSLLFTIGILLLLATEILSVYFIMPFPGSQKSESIGIAYFLHNNVIWIRIIGILFLIPAILFYFKQGKPLQKGLILFFMALYGLLFYFVNFRFLADHMFYQPQNKIMLPVALNRVDTDKLVLGFYEGGQSAAYPIEIIGYHHQVQDTVGGVPVMITYCTVCRTGRIFDPMLGAQKEKFRLVGMDHFNAMFEDAATGSWWRQSTGEAVAGPKKGSKLTELPSFQMRLGSWIRLHPNTRIMQPDSLYQKEYDDLKGYDSGLVKSSLEKRDSSSWKFKSWVIGVNIQGKTRAYDWNELVQKKLINDEIDAEPILLLVEKDGMSFHAFTRKVNGQLLQFALNGNGQLEDEQTHSLWAVDGSSTDGPLKGNKLATIQAYQEFWHSWQAFHPTTSRYEP